MVNKIGIYRDPRNKGRPWACRWFGEYNPQTGNYRRYTKSFKKKVEAEKFAREKATDFIQGGLRDKQQEITLGEFCRHWLKTKRPQLRPGTVILYTNTIRRLWDYFGPGMLVSKLTPMDADLFIAELKPLAREKALSNATRHRALRNCRTIFSDAVTWRIIRDNPFKKVKKPKSSVKRWHYVKADEYFRLLEAAPSLRWKALYALAYTAGLRLGEALNLTWADVDLNEGLVVIDNRGGTDALLPFSVKDNEKRMITLPAQTIKILRDLRQSTPAVFKVPYILLSVCQYEVVLAKYETYRKQRRPWLNRDMANNQLTNFKRHVKKAGIRPNGQLAIHTLRKSCIKTWADHLPPNVVQELAGHADLETTMQYYNKVEPEQRQNAAKMMENWLSKKIG
jgi:integrase